MSRHHPHFRIHRICDWIYRHGKVRPFVNLLRAVFGLGIVLTGITIGLVDFADPSDQKLEGPLADYLQWFHERRFLIVSSLLVFQCLCGGLVWMLNHLAARSGIDDEKLKHVLNRLVDKLFERRSAPHTYRATLFRERRLFNMRWLGVAQRSGDVYVDWSTLFSIHPNKPLHNTGIAGECWFRARSGQGGSFHLKLPPVHEDQDDVDEYTKEGFLDPREFAQLTVRSCFFRACEIRRNGKVWGVLVVDSTDESVYPTTHPAERKQAEAMDNAADTISLLIG